MSLNEEWRVIPSLQEYKASSFGRVRRVPFMKPMPQGGFRQYGGTPTFGVYVPDDPRPTIVFKGKSYRVSKLICEAFHGKKPFEKACVLHDDDNSTNNAQDNLRWGTQKENLNTPKFIAYCKSRTGENNPLIKSRAKATPTDGSSA